MREFYSYNFRHVQRHAAEGPRTAPRCPIRERGRAYLSAVAVARNQCAAALGSLQRLVLSRAAAVDAPAALLGSLTVASEKSGKESVGPTQVPAGTGRMQQSAGQERRRPMIQIVPAVHRNCCAATDLVGAILEVRSATMSMAACRPGVSGTGSLVYSRSSERCGTGRFEVMRGSPSRKAAAKGILLLHEALGGAEVGAAGGKRLVSRFGGCRSIGRAR